MTLQPIVECHGEIPAVPVLLRRLQVESVMYELPIAAPIRKRRSELVRQPSLGAAVQLARVQDGCRAILVLLESDDDCPGTDTVALKQRARAAAAPIPCEVVMAHREYEAWFLAAVESLRGVRGVRADAVSHDTPEAPRDAKGQLEQRLERNRSYSETADQAALTARIDLATVHRRCRSFRQLVTAFGRLHQQAGSPIPGAWPPPGWV